MLLGAFLESNPVLTLFHCMTLLFSPLVTFIERTYLRLTQPCRHSIVLRSAADLTCSKVDRNGENALLRQQLIVLHRQIKKPSFSQSDRLWLIFLATLVKNWKEARLIFKPDTPPRWPHQGFLLFWKFKLHHRGGRPKQDRENNALIQQMAQEDWLWGAERIRAELLKLGLTVARHVIQEYVTRVRPGMPASQTWATS